jgi:beta-N-acetylhexosaminidase
VVDVDAGESSPAIGGLDRALAADAREAARLAGAYIRGLHEAGVAGCLKHFPGHGRAGGDTHEGLVDVTGTWGEDELVPYALLIEEGLADAVMTAHVYNRKWDEKRPASLTPGVVTGMLRCGLGFSGVVFTDDMQMGAVAAEYGFEEAVRLAVKAGADILVYGNNLEYDPEAVARAHGVIMEMVESGEVSRERIEASWERISALKAKITGR